MSRTDILFGLGVMVVGACLTPFIGYGSAVAGLIFGLALIGAGLFSGKAEARERQFFNVLPRIPISTEINPIGGPQILIGYIRGSYLAIQNCGGGIAYTVVLKVPEDGSIFQSRPINILRENLEPTPIQLNDGRMLEATMFVTHNAKGLPVIVECTDGDCHKFIHRFEKMTDQIGYLLKGRK